MNKINTVFQKLPSAIKSFVVANSDLSYIIILNNRLSEEQNQISYLHELTHIENGDYNKIGCENLIRIAMHL